MMKNGGEHLVVGLRNRAEALAVHTNGLGYNKQAVDAACKLGIDRITLRLHDEVFVLFAKADTCERMTDAIVSNNCKTQPEVLWESVNEEGCILMRGIVEVENKEDL